MEKLVLFIFPILVVLIAARVCFELFLGVLSHFYSRKALRWLESDKRGTLKTLDNSPFVVLAICFLNNHPMSKYFSIETQEAILSIAAILIPSEDKVLYLNKQLTKMNFVSRWFWKLKGN